MTNELTRRVLERAPFRREQEAAEVVEAALGGLAALLPDFDRGPLETATGVPVGSPTPVASPSDAERAVADRLDVDPRESREILRTVVAVLPQVVDASLRQRMRQHLPAELGALLDEPGLVSGEPPGPPEADEPTATVRARAHRESVVQSRAPHADRKIASARGTMDDKTGRLATGRPESRRPIASTDPGSPADEEGR